jgi:hypothetical protein
MIVYDIWTLYDLLAIIESGRNPVVLLQFTKEGPFQRHCSTSGRLVHTSPAVPMIRQRSIHHTSTGMILYKRG